MKAHQTEPPQKLRVLVFTTVFPSPRFPLHGTFVRERTRYLMEIADIRSVVPISWFWTLTRGPSKSGHTDNLPVTYLRYWYTPKYFKFLDGLFLFASALRAVHRLRRTFQFDLIDAHFAYPDGFAAVLLGRWFRCPVTVTLRGTIIPMSQRPILRLLCDWTIRRAARVIAVAETLAQRAREGGVPDDRIAVIANGVDCQRFRLIPHRSARQELGLPESGKLLVSVGHISPRKGFHRVIRALPTLVDKFPDLQLIIVGGKGAEEDNTERLRNLASDLGLTDHVVFTGAQPPDLVALWLGAADVFVLATDFEGCPNVVLEAMACGRPVVATRVGDIERMVPSFAGILVSDPENASSLAGSLGDALMRSWDADLIRDHVAARSWDDVARRVEAQWRLAAVQCATLPKMSSTNSRVAERAGVVAPKL